MDTGQYVRARRRARQLELRSHPAHRVVVPPGPDGRPGLELQTASLPRHVGRLWATGVREDLGTMLGLQSELNIVCLGPVTSLGSPAESAHHSLGSMAEVGWVCDLTPTPTLLAGAPAVHYVVRQARSGRTLHEWKLAREGWLFAAGILQIPTDGARVVSLGLAALQTWRWLPGTAQTTNPPALVVERGTGVASRVIDAPRDQLWRLVSSVEHAGATDPNVVEARSLGPRAGVLERQLLVRQVGNVRMSLRLDVLEQHEPDYVLVQMPGMWQERTSYRLEAVPGGTRITIETEFNLPLDRSRHLEASRCVETALDDYLNRLDHVAQRGVGR